MLTIEAADAAIESRRAQAAEAQRILAELQIEIGALEQSEAEQTSSIRTGLLRDEDVSKQRQERVRVRERLADLREELAVRGIQARRAADAVAAAENDRGRALYDDAHRVEIAAAAELDRVLDEVLTPALDRYFDAFNVTASIGAEHRFEGGSKRRARSSLARARIKTLLSKRFPVTDFFIANRMKVFTLADRVANLVAHGEPEFETEAELPDETAAVLEQLQAEESAEVETPAEVPALDFTERPEFAGDVFRHDGLAARVIARPERRNKRKHA